MAVTVRRIGQSYLAARSNLPVITVSKNSFLLQLLKAWLLAVIALPSSPIRDSAGHRMSKPND